jgi:hypothetical protein
MNYVFHPAASDEHLESVAYYESQQPGLGALYLDEFDRIMGFVSDAPTRYPIEKQPDIRRIQMQKFPFSVLYRVSSNTLQVLAIAHHKRRPQYWLGRL